MTVVRNRVAWVKRAPLPSPIGDRLTNSWEYVYHLVKQADYFYDLDAIRVPLTSTRRPRQMTTRTHGLGELAGPRHGLDRLAAEGALAICSERTPVTSGRFRPGGASVG